MTLQVSAVPSDIQDTERHTTSFHRSIWGDYFFKYSSHSLTSDAKTQKEFEALKQEVRRMLISTPGNTLEKLCLIDAVQRLGVAYHFEKEIEDALEELYHKSEGDKNLHTVALRFRLLRQQGYYVPCDVFEKFKDDQGKFKPSVINDVLGMLCLYEAAYLGIPGEDILDEAITFTTSHLRSMVNEVSPQHAEQINHALNQPLRKNLPRLEARYYINVFSGDDSQNHDALLKFAKLDFNMLQVQHQKELSSITEWWYNLDFARKLPYARDRVVECYFWTMGVYYEPQYSFGRRILTKVIKLISIIDDTYDSYGTYEELEVFTDAIQRWEISIIDVLPEYMKHVYRALLDIYCEIQQEIAKEGMSYRMPYAIEAMKRLVRAYFVEAKWCKEGYVPKLEEYMQNSLISGAYPMLATVSFLGMGEIADHQAFEWISNDPLIVKASAIIGRLMDDIVSHEFEQKRKHVASCVECYMKEHSGSREEAIKQFRKEILNAWKDTNKELLKPTAVAMPLLVRILNLSRVSHVVYKDDDGYTNPLVLKDDIASLFVKPVLL